MVHHVPGAQTLLTLKCLKLVAGWSRPPGELQWLGKWSAKAERSGGGGSVDCVCIYIYIRVYIYIRRLVILCDVLSCLRMFMCDTMLIPHIL